MDYDSVHDRVVLADGIGKSTTQVQVSETVRDSGLSGVFGGIHTETHWQQQVKLQYLNDTWEYDGSVWTRVADTGPRTTDGLRPDLQRKNHAPIRRQE
jgi:hypothetical protein